MAPFFKKLTLTAFLFESILFFMLYYFGPNGRHIVVKLAHQKELLHEEIQKYHQDLDDMQQKICIAQTDFAKERIARERLLMKKDNEIVYFRK